MFPTISGTRLQEAIGPASLLKSEILAAGILFSSFLFNSRDLPPCEATATQEWPALSPPFVRQDRRQYSVRLRVPAVWMSATPAVSLG